MADTVLSHLPEIITFIISRLPNCFQSLLSFIAHFLTHLFFGLNEEDCRIIKESQSRSQQTVSQALLMILYDRESSGQIGQQTDRALLRLLMRPMTASTTTLLRLSMMMSSHGSPRPREDALRSTSLLWKYARVVCPLGSTLPWPCHPCQLWPSRRSLSRKEGGQVTRGTRSQESHLLSCPPSPLPCLGWSHLSLHLEPVPWILETSYIFWLGRSKNYSQNCQQWQNYSH